MNHHRALLALIALFFAASCRADSVRHSVSIVIPATVPSIDAGIMRVSLWAHDPMLADGPASGVDHQALAFRHQAGRSTHLHMLVRGTIESGMRSYLVVRGFESTSAGEVMRLWDGLQSAGMPRSVVMRLVTEH